MNILIIASKINIGNHLLFLVRISFDSNPKTGMDSGPTSPNKKFVESGRKS